MQAMELEQQALREQNSDLLRRLGARQREDEEQQARQAAAGMRVQPSVAGPVDTRVMSKPENFSGKQEDWTSWSLGLRAFVGALSPRMLELLKRAEDPAESIDRVDLDPGDDVLDSQLYYVIVMLIKGCKANLIETIDAGEGLQIWRRLAADYEPKIKSRSLASQQEVLRFKLEGSNIVDEVDRFEKLCREYRRNQSSLLTDTFITHRSINIQAHPIKRSLHLFK